MTIEKFCDISLSGTGDTHHVKRRELPMANPTTSRDNWRHLGNTNTKEVHDVTKEDKRPSGCQIDEFLRAGHGVYFTPDSLSQAHSEGYDNCAKCLGGSTR